MDFSFIEDDDLRAKAEEGNKAELKAINESIDTKVSDAISGLQTKNDELIGEKRTVQEKLAAFKGITDPEKALEALNFINENEEVQLIRDGKIEEVIDKRTSQMKLDHGNAVTELADKLELMTSESGKYKGLYETKIMDDSLREVAARAGVRNEAVIDILLRAKELFTLGKDGQPEARNIEGKLVKNEAGNVVTPSVWMEGLKETSPHYWPTSEGAGAKGGNITGDADTTEKLAALAASGDMVGYRKLRATMR